MYNVLFVYDSVLCDMPYNCCKSVCDVQVAQTQRWVWFQTWRRQFQVSLWLPCVTWASNAVAVIPTPSSCSTASTSMTRTPPKFEVFIPSNMPVIWQRSYFCIVRENGNLDCSYFIVGIAGFIITLKGQSCQLATLCHPGLTYIFNFWHSGTLALSPERQSARMSEIKNVG